MARTQCLQADPRATCFAAERRQLHRDLSASVSDARTTTAQPRRTELVAALRSQCSRVQVNEFAVTVSGTGRWHPHRKPSRDHRLGAASAETSRLHSQQSMAVAHHRLLTRSCPLSLRSAANRPLLAGIRFHFCPRRVSERRDVILCFHSCCCLLSIRFRCSACGIA